MNPYDILDISDNDKYDDVKLKYYRKISQEYYNDKDKVIELMNAWRYYKWNIHDTEKTNEEIITGFNQYYNKELEIPSLYELLDNSPFDLLGVTIDTPLKEAKKKFYELALVMHPDKGGRKEDMDVLYDSWKYVETQINYNNTNRTIDLETLEKEFKEFCLNQEKEKCPDFAKLFETNPFTEVFNQEFEKTHYQTKFDAGGYQHLYNESDDLISLNQIIKYNGIESRYNGNQQSINDETVDDYSNGNCYDYCMAYSKNEFNEDEILKQKEIDNKEIYERIENDINV